MIKDTPFDIASLKAKRRYEINKGKKNYRVNRIDPQDYLDELFWVTVEAYSQWPEKYRPHVDKESFIKEVTNWEKYVVLAGFNINDGELCGYALLREYICYVDFVSLRVTPKSEKNGINAAIVAGVLDKYNSHLSDKFYICDGARNIRHETHFQDYLEKYFCFRKAYCKLRLKYRLSIRVIVNLLYPFRKILLKLDNINLFHNVNSILLMEGISRNKED